MRLVLYGSAAHENKIRTKGSISKLENATSRQEITVEIVMDAPGSIKCTACNEEVGCVSSEKNFTVEVHGPPWFPENVQNETQFAVDENGYFILSCPGRGTPAPTISWLKDDVSVAHNDAVISLEAGNMSLKIKKLSRNYTGKYTCIVANDHGRVDLHQYVSIKDSWVEDMRGVPGLWIEVFIILLLTLPIIATHLFMKKSREKAKIRDLQNEILMNFEEGATVPINPELSISEQAQFLPYDTKWEFPRDRLILGETLGSGAFGVVAKAKALGIVAHQDVTTVAVKMVHRSAETIHLRALACELKILVHLGKHLNIVNLLGACTNNIDRRGLLVIVEYCCYGNLRSYLLRHRETFKTLMDPGLGNRFSYGDDIQLHSVKSMSTEDGGNSDPNQVSTGEFFTIDSGVELPCTNSSLQDSTNHSNKKTDSNCSSVQPRMNVKTRSEFVQHLLSWAFQIARGMEYLAQKKILHGDLAARNILLAEDKIVKICDFGLAKTMYKYDNYQKKSDGPVPLRWMAIESIKQGIFSTQSDVWSFGIVLWEFFTIAEIPYPGMRAHKLSQILDQGYRMEQPEYASNDVYEIMLWCWKSDPKLRPTFTQLADRVGELLGGSVKTYYRELNQAYVDCNTQDLNDINGLRSFVDSSDVELTINYGEFLELTCTYVINGDPPEPEFQKIMSASEDSHSLSTSESTDLKLRVKFLSLEFVKKGWYGCADARADFFTGNTGDPIVAWIHVNDKKNVSRKMSYSTAAKADLTSETNCTLSIPFLQPTFLQNVSARNVLADWAFDPRINSILKHAPVTEFHQSFCSNRVKRVFYNLFAFVRIPRRASIILTYETQVFHINAEMHIKCSITVGSEDDFEFQWSSPRNLSFYKILPPVGKLIGNHEVELVYELVQIYTTLDDRGEYICRVKSQNNSYEAKAYIYVYEDGSYYLEVTPSNTSFVVRSGESVELSANIGGTVIVCGAGCDPAVYSKPEIDWYHPDGTHIRSNAKFHIRNFVTKTSLNITSVDVQDTGNFSLKVAKGEKVVNFSLVVIGLDVELKIRTSYTFNKKAFLLCQVQGYPLAKTSWLYTKCPQHPSHGECKEVEIEVSVPSFYHGLLKIAF
ncbi:hypothetical protein QAD02_004668 [Eretmocerus hayati]|uniref:Uncharacterized protein n=1 Tax=Eretmocerus hayati TaxID=131215 RepID=A0ACC2NS31_9HYME|nr:hypothetical protein QAD02_004668 [Eretmocerus hayati]